MLVVAGDAVKNESSIMRYIPMRLRKYFYDIDFSTLEEIRLRPLMPVCLVFHHETCFLAQQGGTVKNGKAAVIAQRQDISEAMELLSASSLYAYEDEISRGYITVAGGHRVGICGSAVTKDNHICFIKNIAGLNYRIARMVKNISEGIIEDIYQGGDVRSTLIISPPGQGKTTMLRDVLAALSARGIAVSVIDERRELAAMYNGVPSFDLGLFTDVLEGCPKDEGMSLMIRSMNPKVVATDEIDAREDMEAIKKAAQRGVRVITSIHAKSFEALKEQEDKRQFLSYFSCFVTLKDKQVQEVAVV